MSAAMAKAKAKKQMNNKKTKAMTMAMAMAMARQRPRPRPRIVARKSEPPSNLFLKKKMNDMAEGIQMEAKPIPSNPDPDVFYSRSATPCLIPDDDDVHIPKHSKCEYEPVASSPPSTPCHLGFPELFNCRPPEPIFYSNATPLSASSSPDSATSPFYYDCPPSPPTGFGFRSHCAPLQQQEYWDSYSDPESVGSSFSPCHRANFAAS